MDKEIWVVIEEVGIDSWKVDKKDTKIFDEVGKWIKRFGWGLVPF